MSFFEKLDELLSALEIPYYEGQPDFGEEPEPEAFISYNVYDYPALSGCGKELVTCYNVTVNIYTSGENRAVIADNIAHALWNLAEPEGFVRRGGSCGYMDDYPDHYHRIIEIICNYNNNE